MLLEHRYTPRTRQGGVVIFQPPLTYIRMETGFSNIAIVITWNLQTITLYAVGAF